MHTYIEKPIEMTLKIPPEVKMRIEVLESEVKPALDYEIGSQLAGLHRVEGLSEEERKGAWAECAAFNFMASQAGEESVWGTHFAPMMSRTTADGMDVHAPDIKDLDVETVEYWESRANKTPQPLLRARYADLVWDLKKVITGERPNVAFAQLAIDGYLETMDRRLYKESISGIEKACRALEIAVAINDVFRIQQVRDAMFTLYDDVAEPRMGGTWPFLFDSLYRNKKVRLRAEQEKRLITSLEEILARTSDRSDKQTFDPWGAQAAAERLARHYQRTSKPDEVQRVIRMYGRAVESMAQEASPLLALSWLQPVVASYRNRGMVEDAARAQLAYEEKGKHVSAEMKATELSVKLSREELNQYFDAVTTGSIEDTLTRIAVQFVPRAEDARKFLEAMKKDHPLMSFIGVERIAEGQIAARAGPVESDPQGRLIFQLAENIHYSWPFLCECLDRARARHSVSAADILTFLFASPVFEEDRRNLLGEGLEAYFNDDFVKAIHVLIPQIEHGLRSLLGLIGIPMNKPHRNRTMQLKNLNDILREDAVKQSLGEDLQLYLLVFLADRGGFNLRNEVCHGLVPATNFRKELADRVIHCLLTLGLIRDKNPGRS